MYVYIYIYNEERFAGRSPPVVRPFLFSSNIDIPKPWNGLFCKRLFVDCVFSTLPDVLTPRILFLSLGKNLWQDMNFQQRSFWPFYVGTTVGVCSSQRHAGLY